MLIEEIRTGFIVDSVTEVLNIHKSSIEAVPHLSKDQGTLQARMADLAKQKRMAQLVAPAYLVGDLERADLVKLVAYGYEQGPSLNTSKCPVSLQAWVEFQFNLNECLVWIYKIGKTEQKENLATVFDQS